MILGVGVSITTEDGTGGSVLAGIGFLLGAGVQLGCTGTGGIGMLVGVH